MALEYVEPSAGGDSVSPKELENHLILVWPIQYYPHVQTKYSDDAIRAGRKSDAVVCDVVDLSSNGTVFRRAFIFQGFLQGAFKPRIGQGPLLGMMVKIPAGPGEKGEFKWNFQSAVGNLEAQAAANAWYESVGGFEPSEQEEYVPPTPPAPPVQQQQPQQQYQGYVQPGQQQQWGQPQGAQPQWQPTQPQWGQPQQQQPSWQQPQVQQPAQPQYQQPVQQQWQQPAPQPIQQATQQPPYGNWGNGPAPQPQQQWQQPQAQPVQQQQMTPLQQMQQMQAQQEVRNMQADGMLQGPPPQQPPLPPPGPVQGIYGQPQTDIPPY